MNIIHFGRRCIRFVKNHGIGGVFKFVTGKRYIGDPYAALGFVTDSTVYPLDPAQLEAHKNDAEKTLNWIVPEMGPGSGGHTTIFRFISHLESMGFHSRIYLHEPHTFYTDGELRRFLKENFPILDSRVECFCNCKDAGFAHATIATSWQTAYFVRNFCNTVSKFYFVQDFEPYFFAMGSEYAFAENTYRFGLRGITAGDWLKNKLHDEYGMETDCFRFSYDKNAYVPGEKTDNVPRVFFYARPVTQRRDFELGILTLNELKKKIPNLEVYFAGWDISQYRIPFEYHSFGICTPKQLCELYHQCDLCLVFSGTNLSLLPLEIMASGSVAVCSKGECNEWLVNAENAILVDHDPLNVAEVMADYLNHPEKLSDIRQKGMDFALGTSWDKEAEKVRDILNHSIEKDLSAL